MIRAGNLTLYPRVSPDPQQDVCGSANIKNLTCSAGAVESVLNEVSAGLSLNRGYSPNLRTQVFGYWILSLLSGKNVRVIYALKYPIMDGRETYHVFFFQFQILVANSRKDMV